MTSRVVPCARQGFQGLFLSVWGYQKTGKRSKGGRRLREAKCGPPHALAFKEVCPISSDPFVGTAEEQPFHRLPKHPGVVWPCSKGPSGLVGCLSSEFEAEAVLCLEGLGGRVLAWIGG